jgi:putative oxidoreductase
MIINRLTRLYELLVRAASNCQSAFLLAIRLYWGAQFAMTGWGKLHSLSDVSEFFGTLGIPFPMFNATLAGATECFGGALLFLGLASRLTALPLIFTMIIAYATADREAVQAIFSDPDKFVTATPFLFMLAALIVLIFGPGKVSLDYLIQRIWGRKGAAPAVGEGRSSLHGVTSAV